MDIETVFLCLVQWKMHPGFTKPGTAVVTIEDCWELAEEIVEFYNGRMGSICADSV